MAVEGINTGVASPSFYGEEQKRKSGIGAFGIGTLGAGFAASQLMKKPMTQDVFQSNLKEGKEIKYTSELDAKQKDLVAKAEKEAKSEAPKTDAKTEVPKTDAPKKTSVGNKSLVTEATVDDIFFSDKELTHEQYLNSKYGVSNTQGLMDEIKLKNKELNESNPIKEIRNAQYKLTNAKNNTKTLLENTKLENNILLKKLEIDELKSSLDEVDGKTPKAKSIQRAMDAKTNELNRLILQKSKMKPVNTEFKVNEKAIDDMISKAVKPGGRIDVAANKAVNAKLKDLQDKAAADVRKKCQADKLGREATELKIEEAKKAVITEQKETLNKVYQQTVLKKGSELSKNALEEQVNRFANETVNNAQNNLHKAQKSFAKQKATIQEMNADLELVRNAKKNNTKITKEAADAIIKKGPAKISEEIGKVAKQTGTELKKNATTALTEAYEAVKGKLPKTKAGLTLAVAGIGLGVGAIMAMIVRSGNKSEQA